MPNAVGLLTMRAFDANTGTFILLALLIVILIYMLFIGRFPATKSIEGGLDELRRRVTECEENERKLRSANADLHNVVRVIAEENTKLNERVKTLETELESAVTERDRLQERNGHLEYMLANFNQISGGAAGSQKLRDALVSGFSVTELQALCADLGLGYEDVEGDNKVAKVQGIVLHFQRRDELPRLTAAVRKLRPKAQL